MPTGAARPARTWSSPIAAAASAGRSTDRFRGAPGSTAVPSSWADGSRGWNGWLEPAEYPRLVDPPGGRIWTANARVVDGEMLARLGDGSYEVGSRARIIRDRLMAARPVHARATCWPSSSTPAPLFLARWRDLILRTLDTAPATATRRGPRRVPRLVEQRLDRPGVTRFGRLRLRAAVPRRGVDAGDDVPAGGVLRGRRRTFDHTPNRRREGPVWKLITERPMHLLDPAYASWDELLLDVDRRGDRVRGGEGNLGDRGRGASTT